jgi:hypothetical protein
MQYYTTITQKTTLPLQKKGKNIQRSTQRLWDLVNQFTHHNKKSPRCKPARVDEYIGRPRTLAEQESRETCTFCLCHLSHIFSPLPQLPVGTVISQGDKRNKGYCASPWNLGQPSCMGYRAEIVYKVTASKSRKGVPPAHICSPLQDTGMKNKTCSGFHSLWSSWLASFCRVWPAPRRSTWIGGCPEFYSLSPTPLYHLLRMWCDS